MAKLSMDYIKELLDGGSDKPFDPSNGYMILRDGSKVPIDSSCGVWTGKAGSSRKLIPGSPDVIAVVSKVVVS